MLGTRCLKINKLDDKKMMKTISCSLNVMAETFYIREGEKYCFRDMSVMENCHSILFVCQLPYMKVLYDGPISTVKLYLNLHDRLYT